MPVSSRQVVIVPDMGYWDWPDQITGFPQALENLENHKKSSMHGKIMEFEKKNLKNHGIL